MKLNKLIAAVGVATAATATLGALTMVPANADPVRAYAAVGSDTTQDVWNGLTNDQAAVAPSIASYNATSDGVAYQTIQTKTGGHWFARPNGSGDGAKALSAVWDPSYTSHLWAAGGVNAALDHEDVDFSRSSGGPNAGTGLTYIPFGRDAVSVAFNTSTGLPASLNLTTGQLTELYSGVDNTADSVVTFAAGLPQINGISVTPLIPQSSSGTRKFFQGAIGVTNAQLAGYVTSNSSATLPENSGIPLAAGGSLVPFSAAQWIAQKNQVATSTLTSDLALASINGTSALSGTAPNLTPGALYGASSLGKYTQVPGSGVGVFNRDTYNVVPTVYTSGPTDKQSTLLGTLTGGNSGQIGSGSGQTIMKAYGFGILSYFGQSTKNLSGAYQH